MRVSQLLLPTVKEDPAGAEAVSHKLMVRAGLVRQLAAGIYVYLPAGWRVMQKIEQIIREEMDAIGCQEMLMPVMNPAEIWQQSGRWDAIGDELFRLKDRKGADIALAMTHEEVVTWLAAREVHSYKQLPQHVVSLPDQGARRGAAEERHATDPRIHHEGRVQPRRQLRGPASELPAVHRPPTTASTRAAASAS